MAQGDRRRDRVVARREFLRGGLAGAAALSLGPGGLRRMAVAAPPVTPTADQFDPEVPAAWFDLSLDLVKQTAGFSPPVASRGFAYAGISLYEALVPGMPDHRSLAGQLNGLSELPHAGNNRVYHWPTVANSSMAAILRSLFPVATTENQAAIDRLEARFAALFRSGLPPGHGPLLPAIHERYRCSHMFGSIEFLPVRRADCVGRVW